MSKTILVVEDNELNLRVFQEALLAHGYSCLDTSDGMEAIELARKHHPDLILMDIQLPGISGTDVTRMLKSMKDVRDIPVIAVTAFAMKGDEERIRQCGCEDYLSKPIRISTLIETIERHLK